MKNEEKQKDVKQERAGEETDPKGGGREERGKHIKGGRKGITKTGYKT